MPKNSRSEIILFNFKNLFYNITVETEDDLRNLIIDGYNAIRKTPCVFEREWMKRLDLCKYSWWQLFSAILVGQILYNTFINIVNIVFLENLYNPEMF